MVWWILQKEKKNKLGFREKMEFDSGGHASLPDDEGNHPPLFEKVGGSPVYKLDGKLGNGYFEQVYVGGKFDTTTPKTRFGTGAMEVALKFEHRSSIGCNYRPPYE